MVSGLTVSERQLALVVLALLALCGLAMAVAGRGDPLGAHGFIVLAFGVGIAFLVMAGYHAPEPPEERLSHYYDDPTKAGIVLAMIWAVVGMFFGVWVAALLAWPDLTFDAGWASFGRLRPVHTSGVIFGFGVLIGVLVGLVIVYQVLSTDVADHMREYATFKAMGYGPRFFLGIVLEQALVLGVFGFIPGFAAGWGILTLMKAVTQLPLAMTPAMAIGVFAGTVVFSALSGFVATRKLAAADPADLF